MSKFVRRFSPSSYWDIMVMSGTDDDMDYYERNLEILEYDDADVMSEDDSRSPSPEGDVDQTLESLDSDRFSSEATLLRIFSLENELDTLIEYCDMNLNFSLPNLEFNHKEHRTDEKLDVSEESEHGSGVDVSTSSEATPPRTNNNIGDSNSMEEVGHKIGQQGAGSEMIQTSAAVIESCGLPISSSTKPKGILAYCRRRGFEYDFQKSVYSRISEAVTTCSGLLQPASFVSPNKTTDSLAAGLNTGLSDDETSSTRVGLQSFTCSPNDRSKISDTFNNSCANTAYTVSRFRPIRNNSLKQRNLRIVQFLLSKGFIPSKVNSCRSDTDLFIPRDSQCSTTRLVARKHNHTRSQSLIEKNSTPIPTYLNQFLSNSSILSSHSLSEYAKRNHSIYFDNLENTLENMLDDTLDNLSLTGIQSNFSTMSHQSSSDVMLADPYDVIDATDNDKYKRRLYRNAMVTYSSSVSQICSDYWSRSSSCEAHVDTPANLRIPSSHLTDVFQQNGTQARYMYDTKLCTEPDSTSSRSDKASVYENCSNSSSDSERTSEIESNSDVDLSLYEDRRECVDHEFYSDDECSSDLESRPEHEATAGLDAYCKHRDAIYFDYISGTFHDNILKGIDSNTNTNIRVPTNEILSEADVGLSSPHRIDYHQLDIMSKLYKYDDILDDQPSVSEYAFPTVPVGAYRSRSPENVTCKSNPNIIRLSQYQIKPVRSD